MKSMKQRLLTCLILIATISGINAQNLQILPLNTKVKSEAVPNAEEQKTSMQIGYSGDLTSATGFGPGVETKSAIQIPAEYVKKISGNKLTAVMIGAGLESGKNLQLFLTYKLEDAPFYTQDIKLSARKWSTITLTTPYEIEDKEFFIGYSLTAGTNSSTYFPIGMDAGPVNQYGDWVARKNNQSEFEWMHLSESGFTNVCIKGVIEGESVPQYDMSLEYIDMKGFVVPNESFQMTGKVRNIASQPITSFDLNYQIGNAAPVTVPYTIENGIENINTYSFTINDIKMPEEGNYPIKVTVSNPNYKTDEDESDNLINQKIICTTKSTKRKVLLENFTTAECQNCPRAHTLLESVLGDNENVIWVAHHSGYKTDDFTIRDSEIYLWLYNANSVFAPAIMFDRTNLSEYGAKGYGNVPAPGPVFSPSNNTIIEKTLNARLEAPAYVTVNIGGEYKKENNELSVTVSGEAITGDLPDNVRMNLFLIEDGLVGRQTGGGNNYIHNHVIRVNLSDVWGDKITLTEGSYQKTYTTQLNSEWKAENMKVVAFLSEYNFRDANKCNVYNAEAAQLSSLNGGSSIEQTKTADIRLYNVNENVFIEGNYDEATVYRVDGTIVKQVKDTDHFGLENGMYLIKVRSNNATSTHKVMVCK